MKGVNLGCVIFALLFNILPDIVMREALDNYDNGTQNVGRKSQISHMLMTLFCWHAELQYIVHHIEQESNNQGLLINVDKTSIVVTQCNMQHTITK